MLEKFSDRKWRSIAYSFINVFDLKRSSNTKNEASFTIINHIEKTLDIIVKVPQV